MEMVKICFKCEKVKPLDEFYKHPKMYLGCLNKCKECTKKDSNKRHNTLSKNPEWVKKEKERSLEKYYRLYARRQKKPRKKPIDKSVYGTNNRNMSRNLKRLGVNMDGKVAHHWNYNLPKSVLVIKKPIHYKIHSDIILDECSKVFSIRSTGEVLDTIEKHINFIQQYDTDILPIAV